MNTTLPLPAIAGLRDYQMACLQASRDAFARGVWSQVVVLPTGSGKTQVFSHLPQAYADWLAQFPTSQQKVLVLAHRDELLQQAAEKLARYNPDLRIGYEAADRRTAPMDDVVVASVQTLSARSFTRLRLMDPLQYRIVVVDEAHHAPSASYQEVLGYFGLVPPNALWDVKRAEDAALARTRVREWWLTNWPNRLLVGVTATPARGDAIGLEWTFRELVYERSLRWMIDRGYLCALTGYVVETGVSLDAVRQTAGDFNVGQLAQVVNTPSRNLQAVAAWMTAAQGRRTLAFTVDVQHAVDLARAFRAQGINAEAVSGNDKERTEKVQEFRQGLIDVLCNCNLLTEGFDAPETSCILHCRPTQSAGLYMQMCLDAETQILTEGGWLGINDAWLAERVAAFDLSTGAIHWSDATRVEYLRGQEQMWGIESPHLSIRVTGGHKMVISSRTRKGRSGWRLRPAEVLPAAFYVPVSGTQESGEAPISDADISFLGLLLTDGNYNPKNRQVTLYQSERYPFVVEFVRSTLASCGMKTTESVRREPSNFGPRRPLHKWTVSYGRPRGTDTHLRGWAYLAAWVSDTAKTLTPAYEQLSARQVRVLADALHAGDGLKRATVGWVEFTRSICANVALADQLQSLFVRRGLRCNQAVRTSALSMLHVSESDEWSVCQKASDDRPTWGVVPSTADERVWCVTVDTGAIVTRRHGKIAIVGNTGRGTRLADGKQDCLVLDVVDVARKHSLLTAGDLFGLPKRFNAKGQDLNQQARVADDLRAQFPDAPLLEGLDPDTLNRTLTRLDLWAVRESETANKLTRMRWVEDSPERFHVALPKRGEGGGLESSEVVPQARVEVLQAMLGGWEVRVLTGSSAEPLGALDDLGSAFARAERWVETARPDAWRMKQRDARWRDKPASKDQLALLKRMKAPMPLEGLTRGQASDFLDRVFSKKGRKV